ETEFDTGEGTLRVTDCMTPRHVDPEVVRLVECVSGRVDARMELVIRFDYGSIIPWVRRLDGGLVAVGGPDSLYMWTPVETRRAGTGGHRAVVAVVGLALDVPGRVARCRAALARHAEGADLRADGRDSGRRDHVATGAAGRSSQLGLPLLLGARRHLHAERAH